MSEAAEDSIKAAHILPADRARLLKATKKLTKTYEGVELKRAIPLPEWTTATADGPVEYRMPTSPARVINMLWAVFDHAKV